ncbi:MAG: NAD(P)/FAD-dependent oxidoreductase [Thermoplasmata archaeon]
MFNHDVVVAGGGPAGLHTAKCIAEKGFNVVVLEEHYEIGKPLQCAGLVTPRVFDIVGNRPKRAILNELRGAHIYSPNGTLVNVDGKNTRAVVVDRSIFDSELAKIAIRAGVKIRLGAKVIDVKNSKNPSEGVKITVSPKGLTNGGLEKINAKLLILATGSQSRLPRALGIPSPKEILSGFEIEFANMTDLTPNFVELFSGSKVANDFFAWIIPLSSKDNALVGLCVSNSETNAYEKVMNLKDYPFAKRFLKKAKPIRYIAGTIPIGLLSKTYANNLLVVGDAACQVKPLTGGGVYTGLKSAVQCAHVASLAIESNDFSEQFLSRYQLAWLNEIGKELKRGLKLRELYVRLTDEEMDEILNIVNDPALLELISKYGDIDYPSKVSMVMFKKVPKLLKFAPKILGSLMFARA